MSFKSFLIKKTLQLKGVDASQAETIASEIEKNPELMNQLKELEKNTEIKTLLESIQKEIEEKKKTGMADAYAMVMVMEKYKSDIAKHRAELEPFMRLLMKQ